jgi:predicted cupin superfamily sugar epimerase
MGAQDWIQKLGLKPHPEGGYYREVFRSNTCIPENVSGLTDQGKRSTVTSIYYLLEKDDFSAFHRIKSDELWFFHAGSTLDIHTLSSDQGHQLISLGFNSASLQTVVHANTWFAARLNPIKEENFALVSCVVAPGFEFQDFEMADRNALCYEFPEFKNIIKELTRLNV